MKVALREFESIRQQFDSREIFVFDDLFIADKARAHAILSALAQSQRGGHAC